MLRYSVTSVPKHRGTPSTFSLLFQEPYPLNKAVIHFLKNKICNKQLLNVCQENLVCVGTFLVFLTVCLLKTFVENYFVPFHMDFAVCKSGKPLCCVNSVTCKVSLIHEQNIRKNFVAMTVAIHKILHAGTIFQ